AVDVPSPGGEPDYVTSSRNYLIKAFGFPLHYELERMLHEALRRSPLNPENQKFRHAIAQAICEDMHFSLKINEALRRYGALSEVDEFLRFNSHDLPPQVENAVHQSYNNEDLPRVMRIIYEQRPDLVLRLARLIADSDRFQMAVTEVLQNEPELLFDILKA